MLLEGKNCFINNCHITNSRSLGENGTKLPLCSTIRIFTTIHIKKSWIVQGCYGFGSGLDLGLDLDFFLNDYSNEFMENDEFVVDFVNSL